MRSQLSRNPPPSSPRLNLQQQRPENAPATPDRDPEKHHPASSAVEEQEPTRGKVRHHQENWRRRPLDHLPRPIPQRQAPKVRSQGRPNPRRRNRARGTIPALLTHSQMKTEYNLMREFDDPNVCRAIEIIDIPVPKQTCIVMEYVELCTIKTLIGRNIHGLREMTIKAIAKNMLRVLKKMHSK